MNRIQEVKHWLEEGDLESAEKAIIACSKNITHHEKEEFETLLNEISVRQYRQLAAKAIISKDKSLLKLCIQKLNDKSASTEGLQNSLNHLISERRAVHFQRLLIITFGLISIIFSALFVLA
ncbi:MAG: hypothetical protein RLZZ91_206 [Bacteroidota bacterium]|jgi:outer membrane PBP1 activator LpoA protein